MKLYLSVISISMLIISALNMLFNTAAWYYVIISVIWCAALQFAFDGTIAIIINKLPDSWFSVTNRLYDVPSFEAKLCKIFRVRLWKDKVWELGGLGGFSKKELKEPGNKEYVAKFIIECNKGVLTHVLSYPIGFLAMLTLKSPCQVTIALPVAVVNLFLNILPTMVLRYNTPKLKLLLKRLQRNRNEKVYK